MKNRRVIGRRKFLQTSAGTVAAASAAPMFIPATSLGAKGRPGPTERIVVGSIGTGDLGR